MDTDGHGFFGERDGAVVNGAIGSHIEKLQRKGGFKGFNQDSVSVIFAAVDPRKHLR